MNIDEIKLKIKFWEKDFHEKHKRPPKTDDIKLAPREIVELYKAYKKRKISTEKTRVENVNPWDVKPTKPKIDNKSMGKSFDSIISDNILKARRNMNKCEEKFEESDEINIDEKENRNNRLKRSFFERNSLSNERIDSEDRSNIKENTETEKSMTEKTFDINIDKSVADINEKSTKNLERSIKTSSFFSERNVNDKNTETFSIFSLFQRKSLLEKASEMDLDKIIADNDKKLTENRERSIITSQNSLERKPETFSNCPLFPRKSLVEKTHEIELDAMITDKISREDSNQSIKSSTYSSERNVNDKKPESFSKFSLFQRKSLAEKASEMDLDTIIADNDKKLTENREQLINIPIERKTKERKIDYSPMKQTKSISFKKGNENYVKLNMKYRGSCLKVTAKQKATRNAFRRTKWNNKLRNFGKCFRCGVEGHYADKCPIRPTYGPKDEKNTTNVLGFTDLSQSINISDFKLQTIDQIACQITRESFFEQSNLPTATREELFDSDDLDECLKKSLKLFGFSEFRNEQENIIRRICSGKSTLAVLPTGSGKSLCYQIPAYIFQQTRNSVALIISPLISLMQDQLIKLPKSIKGVALNSTLKFDEKRKLLKEINENQYAFVLVSPEALVESNWLTADQFPSISFACIDEVHCLSDWSHHFRPSYLRVCKLLRDKFKIDCFLGLSATCTVDTIETVAKYLHIDPKIDPESVVRHVPIPENITIAVTEVTNKENALISLLQKPPFDKSSSILIYCSSREETVSLAALIRDRLGSIETVVDKKKLIWSAESYHAGLSSADRSKKQRSFMRGRTRVLVATIAFGMGLDKSDIRAVIHYSRPRSFENYVQEIGRAGRDSLPAHALVLTFNDRSWKQEQEELNDLHRHTYTNHVEFSSLKSFVQSIFVDPAIEKCRVGECRGHVKGFAPSEMAVRLNIREETLMTILCYLELFEQFPCLRILPANYRYCKINCYRGPKQMAELSHKLIPISVALTNQFFQKTMDLTNCRSIQFDMIEMWEKYGLDLSIIRKEVKSMEWNQSVDREGQVRYSSTGVSNEFIEWNWIFCVRCDLNDDQLNQIVDHLFSRLKNLENSSIEDVGRLFKLLKNNRSEFDKIYNEENAEDLLKKSKEIRSEIVKHFNSEKKENSVEEKETKDYSKPLELEVRNHIRAFISQYKSDNVMTGRSIASVLHGINCPLYPSVYWAGQKTFWKSLLNIDFITLMKWANEELRYFL